MSTASSPVTPPSWLGQVLAEGQSESTRGQWSVPDDGARASAVLMLFGPAEPPARGAASERAGAETGAGIDVDVDVVLTERAATLRKHAGQVSFPGGGVEDQDESFTATALREAQEEIGLAPEGVHVLGELAPVPLTITNFSVCPVLAWWNVPSQISALDPIEVARVERVRVADLVDPANRHTATHPRGFAGPAFTVGGLYVWGFTAFLLDAVLEAGGVSRPWDVDDRRQVPDRFLR